MKTAKQRWIYHLLDQVGAVRYVGCSVNPRGRFYEYVNRAKSMMRLRGWDRLNPFNRWIIEHYRNGTRPRVSIIRHAADDWHTDEFGEIKRLLDSGSPLLNVQMPGRAHQGTPYIDLVSPPPPPPGMKPAKPARPTKRKAGGK